MTGWPALQQNLDLGDVGKGLRLWWSAIREVGSNPVYLILRRRRAGRRGALPATILFGVILAAAFLPLGMAAARHWWPLTYMEFRLLPAVLTLLALYLVWAGQGLYDAVARTLSLLSAPGELRYGAVQLDEALLGSRLDDRDNAVGLTAAVLPQLAVRWAGMPPAVLAGWVLYVLSFQQVEPGMAAEGLSVRFEAFELGRLLAWLPLSIPLLYCYGLLAGCILLLWLIALGRNTPTAWQLGLIAGSVSVLQVVWPFLALRHIDIWRISLASELLLDWVIPWFSTLVPLAFLTAVLQFSRRRAEARLRLVWLLGAAGIGLMVLLGSWYGISGASQQMIGPAAIWYGELVWSFSGLALLNPFCLPQAQFFGLPPEHALAYKSMSLLRALGLLALMLAYLAVCSHAARLAIQDWRVSAE